jgi:hypothetical protein
MYSKDEQGNIYFYTRHCNSHEKDLRTPKKMPGYPIFWPRFKATLEYDGCWRINRDIGSRNKLGCKYSQKKLMLLSKWNTHTMHYWTRYATWADFSIFNANNRRRQENDDRVTQPYVVNDTTAIKSTCPLKQLSQNILLSMKTSATELLKVLAHRD